ncbi:MAG: hypothetical protein AB7Q37_11410 [Pyrinomonadaceae bacterium]
MEDLKISEDQAPAIRPKFLARQFSQQPTLAQQKFDWTFGVILPIVCVAADPCVFRSSIGFEVSGPLVKFKIFAYILSSISIMSIAAWLLWGNKLGGFRPFLGGLFLAAAAVSTLVGVVLFPISVLGSFLIIGVLGFTPLFSGFVFLRNASRAIEASVNDLPLGYVVKAAMLTALYALVVPFVLNF